MKQQLLPRQNSQSLINAQMFFSSKKWWIVPQVDNVVITASRVMPDQMTQQNSVSVRYERQSIPEKLREKTIIIYLWPNSNF